MRVTEFPAAPSEPAALGRNWPAMMRALPDLLTVIDRDGVIEFVSSSAWRLLGLGPELIVAHLIYDFVPDDDRRNVAAWLAHAQSAPSGDHLPELVHRLRRRDGSYVWLETRLRPMHSEDERGQVVAVSRDISQRTAVDRQMAATSHLWSDIYDVVREGVLVINADGVVVCANRVAGRLLGVRPQDLAGAELTKHLTVLAADGQPIPDDPLLGVLALRDRPVENLVVAARRPDGRMTWLRARAERLAHAGVPGGAGRVAILLDGEVTPELGASPPNSDQAPEMPIRHLLSRREIEVLRLLTDGLDVRAVSAQLGISIHTTRDYVKSVLRKLEVRTQLQAVVLAIRSGLLELS